MTSVRGLLDWFVTSFNEGRYEEGHEHYAKDAIQEEIGTGRRLSIEEGIASARAWKEAFPDARGTIESMIVEGNRGAAEVVWNGTNTGPLNGMPPTNKRASVRAVVVIETDGNVITGARHYLDVAGMMAQLGMMPGAQPQAEPAGTRR